MYAIITRCILLQHDVCFKKTKIGPFNPLAGGYTKI